MDLLTLRDVNLMSPYNGSAKYFSSALLVSTGIDHRILLSGVNSDKEFYRIKKMKKTINLNNFCALFHLLLLPHPKIK